MKAPQENIPFESLEQVESREFTCHAFVPNVESRQELLEVSKSLAKNGLADKSSLTPPEDWHVTIASLHVPQARPNHPMIRNGSRRKIINNIRFFNIKLNENLRSEYHEISFIPEGFSVYSYSNQNLLGLDLVTPNGEKEKIRSYIAEQTKQLSRFVLKHLRVVDGEVDLVQTSRFHKPHIILAEYDEPISDELIEKVNAHVALPEAIRCELAPPAF